MNVGTGRWRGPKVAAANRARGRVAKQRLATRKSAARSTATCRSGASFPIVTSLAAEARE